MKRTGIFSIYKLFFGLLAICSVTLEIFVLNERGIFNPFNFFSFFTIQSNLLAAGVLLVGAWYSRKGKRSDTFDVLRGASTLYMALTGVVFAVLLSNIDPRLLTAVPWDNTVLHYIMPIIMVLDWVLDPPKRKVTMRQALPWLMYPIVYVAYSLIRGPFAEWYPYPFLNPANGGYATIAITSVCIAAFALAAAWLLVKSQRLMMSKS
jgi:hypothetical protein